MKILISLAVLLFMGCASKTVPDLSASRPSKKISKSSTKELDKTKIIKIITSCKIDDFKTLDLDQLLILRTDNLLTEHWKNLYANPSCINTIDFLAQNSIINENIMAMYELLEPGNKEIIQLVLKSNIIPEYLQIGVEKQLRKLMARLYDTKYFKIYSYKLQIPIVQDFLKFRELKAQQHIAQSSRLEEWIIGREYNICGFFKPTLFYSTNSPGTNTDDNLIYACQDKKDLSVKVIDIDKDWLFFKKTIPRNVYENAYEEEKTAEERTAQGLTYKVMRRYVTTPYILTDGQFRIAIANNSIDKISIGKNWFKPDGYLHCDDIDREPNINRSDEIKNQFDQQIYYYPKGFQIEKAELIKNFYGGFSHEDECTSGC